MNETKHIPVLLEPSIEILDVSIGDVVVDGTFGGGGHTAALVARYGSSIELICVDLDEAAEMRFNEQFADMSNVTFIHANFKDADDILARTGQAHANRVLLDLGTSTFQLLADERGFSFHSDMPLSMTFSRAGSHTGFTAYDIVNSWGESSIADIIYGYGEETKARVIASAIVSARAVAPISTASELAAVIERVVPQRYKPNLRGKRIHPATKTFQALRIAVNDELAVITLALDAWWARLAPGGRIAVITFHSLEDRIVKQWMAAKNSGKTNKRVITKKPISPDPTELHTNPRARSAKLRAIEKE